MDIGYIDVSMLKQQWSCRTIIAPQEIVYCKFELAAQSIIRLKYECFCMSPALQPLAVGAIPRLCIKNFPLTVWHKWRNTRVTRRKSSKRPEKSWRRDIQIFATFAQQCSAFLKMLIEYSIVWDRWIERVNISLYLIHLRNDKIGLLYSVVFSVGLITRQFTALKVTRMHVKKLVVPATTD